MEDVTTAMAMIVIVRMTQMNTDQIIPPTAMAVATLVMVNTATNPAVSATITGCSERTTIAMTTGARIVSNLENQAATQVMMIRTITTGD